jgi:formiminoglutamate deiminase
VTTFWCELAWLGGHTAAANVAIEVAGDRITAVTADSPCPADAVRLSGLTLPGMANAHSHAFHRALRGRTHGGTGSFWTWRDQMYAVADRLDPDTYHDLARATFAEMALAGFTVVGEFHYLHHGPGGARYADPNAIGEALLAAAAEAGIRITLLDTCYLHGGFDDELNHTQRRFSDGDVEAWGERVAMMTGSSTAKIGAAVHSVRAVDPTSITAMADWATKRDVPLHAHVSEQPTENEQSLAAYGRTPTGLLHDCGALTDRFTAVHATHLSDDDVVAMRSNRVTCCICPTTERDLADGIGPTAAWRESGIAMCLGSDSQAVIDPFEEARGIELDERLTSLRRGTHQPGELLTAATSTGYRSLGWSDGGHLQIGALADLTSVALTSPRLAGTDAAQAVSAVVFGAAAADVHHVVVGGRVVVAGGVHQTVDVAAELDRSIWRMWS